MKKLSNTVGTILFVLFPTTLTATLLVGSIQMARITLVVFILTIVHALTSYKKPVTHV